MFGYVIWWGIQGKDKYKSLPLFTFFDIFYRLWLKSFYPVALNRRFDGPRNRLLRWGGLSAVARDLASASLRLASFRCRVRLEHRCCGARSGCGMWSVVGKWSVVGCDALASFRCRGGAIKANATPKGCFLLQGRIVVRKRPQSSPVTKKSHLKGGFALALSC